MWSRDWALLLTAAHYDLSQASERGRSCTELVDLFFDLVHAARVDLFVEAGAKDAAASVRAAGMPGIDRVVAFEANPYTHRRFGPEATAQGELEYLHLALSDQPGTATFNVLRNPKGKPRADGQSSLLKRGGQYEHGYVEVTVPATTLDTFFAGHDYARAGIWMDVEGATELVLSGAGETLKRTAAVMVEVEDRPYWGEGQWLSQDVLSFLHDHGLTPVARDFQSRFQYNVVFVHYSMLDAYRVRAALTQYYSRAATGRPSGQVATQRTRELLRQGRQRLEPVLHRLQPKRTPGATA